MVARIPTHVAHTHSNSVAHAYDAELGDRVLLEKLRDELPHIAQSESVPCGPKVFLRHGRRQVNDEDQMADNASLDGGGVFE